VSAAGVLEEGGDDVARLLPAAFDGANGPSDRARIPGADRLYCLLIH
jgi:hypothetical protein